MVARPLHKTSRVQQKMPRLGRARRSAHPSHWGILLVPGRTEARIVYFSPDRAAPRFGAGRCEEKKGACRTLFQARRSHPSTQREGAQKPLVINLRHARTRTTEIGPQTDKRPEYRFPFRDSNPCDGNLFCHRLSIE
jgi:hypothetical protein